MNYLYKISFQTLQAYAEIYTLHTLESLRAVKIIVPVSRHQQGRLSDASRGTRLSDIDALPPRLPPPAALPFDSGGTDNLYCLNNLKRKGLGEYEESNSKRDSWIGSKCAKEFAHDLSFSSPTPKLSLFLSLITTFEPFPEADDEGKVESLTPQPGFSIFLDAE
nr:hypothetical protein Iba_chr14fCG0610 [Ipomoea batatas]